MAIPRQMDDLQNIDLQMQSQEQALKQKLGQQQESEALRYARNRAETLRQRLDDVRKQQRSLEYSVSDLVAKIAASEDQLYGGRIRNPKELIGLQSEVNSLKARREEQETHLLQVMEEAESLEKDAGSAAMEYKTVETQWQQEQRQLSAEIEQIKAKLTELHKGLDALSCEIDAESLDLYRRIKRTKGQAVARVEQGVCRGCRISLSSSEVLQAGSDSLVTCSSCGRILYLP